MLDARQFEDLKEIFPALVLFGDPAQLAPVGQSGQMVFDRFKPGQRLELNRIHRQEADNPILDLAHALGRSGPDLRTLRADDRRRRRPRRPRPHRAPRRQRHDGPLPGAGLAQRHAHPPDPAFRAAHGAPEDQLIPGEPLICDGIELPLKHRKRRIDLEARGLIKGAPVIYLGPGNKDGFSRLHVIGAESPRLSAASIVKIENRGRRNRSSPSPHAWAPRSCTARR
jgi:exodeoxyribonuclease-5